MAVDLLCSKIGCISPNMAYVTDAPIPGVTVKACQRGMMNLQAAQGIMDKSFGSTAFIGGDRNGGYYPGLEGYDPAAMVSGADHSFLTMGEYRSKALSVVKPHENLEPIENFHPLRRLIENPNRWDTIFDLLYESQMFQELCGVSYIWAVPNDFGVPCELWVIPSHWVWPRTGGGRLTQIENEAWRPMQPSTYVPPDSPHADELIHYYEVRPWGGMGSAGILRIPPDQIIMERWKSPINKIDGYSKLAAISQWIDLEESISKSRWSQMINTARPELWIELGPGYEDPSDNMISRIEAKFAQKFIGEFNYGKPIITPPGAKLTPLSFSPAEMAYFESANQMRDMILATWRIPKSAVGLVDSMTYGSILATLGALCSMALNPRLAMRGQGLTKHLASRWNEETPAWSSRQNGGSASFKMVKLWWDDCLDTETECLTAEGWKKHDELTMDTRIACYDDETDTLIYRKPIRIINRPHQGDLYVWEGGRIDAAMTPRHRVWVYNKNKCGREKSGWGIMQAKDLQPYAQTFKIKRAAKAACDTPSNIEVERYESAYRPGAKGKCQKQVGIDSIDPSLWLEFLGYYISEGSLDSGSLKRKPTRVTISQNIDNPCFEKISKCLGSLDVGEWKFRRGYDKRHDSDKYAQFRCINKGLADHLIKHCGVGSRNKKIPDYVKAWPAEYLRILLDALIAGDGSRPCVNANTGIWRCQYTSVSKQLRDDVMEIAVKCGLSAAIRADKVNLSTRTVVLVQPENRKVISYDGTVWCVEVPTGKFVVRRNGKAHITGNCVPADPQQVNADIQADLSGYAITPNEIRALRGRKAYGIGGNNPMAQGAGGVAPLIINEKEEADELVEMIQKLTEATQPQQEEGAGGGMPGMPGAGGEGGAGDAGGGEEDIFKPELPESGKPEGPPKPGAEGEAEVPKPEAAGIEEPNGPPSKEAKGAGEGPHGDDDLPDEVEPVDEKLWAECQDATDGSIVDGKTVRIVDGDQVRHDHEMDFLFGGNGYRYDWFIPKDEIWIDNTAAPEDVPLTLYHEAHEIRLMASGMSYDDAHKICNGTDRLLIERVNRSKGLVSKAGTCKPGQNPARDHCTPVRDEEGGAEEGQQQEAPSAEGGAPQQEDPNVQEGTIPATEFMSKESLKALDDIGAKVQKDPKAAEHAKGIFHKVKHELTELAVEAMSTVSRMTVDNWLAEEVMHVQTHIEGASFIMEAAAYGAAKAYLGIRKLMRKETEGADIDKIKKVMQVLAKNGGFRMPTDEQLQRLIESASKGKAKGIRKVGKSYQKKAGPFKYSSTQIDLPQLAKGIMEFAQGLVTQKDLAEDGYEDNPHVTVKYGLHTTDMKEVKELVSNFGPVSVKLGPVGVFYANEVGPQRGKDHHDVVYMSVDSEDLGRLNKLLGQLPHTDTHATYKPHVTLAYAKAGTGHYYEGAPLPGWADKEFTVDELAFTTPDGAKVNIPLNGGMLKSRAKMLSQMNGKHKNGTAKQTEEEIYNEYRAKFRKALSGEDMG